MIEKKSIENDLVTQLKETDYSALFQRGEHNMIDSIWQSGGNKNILQQIVINVAYDDYIRLLASEILYAKDTGYPQENLKDTLAYVYSKALSISGQRGKYLIPGNQWGGMYYSEGIEVDEFGNLGKHLIDTGKVACSYLSRLLNDENTLIYEGSREATLGNMLKYRVKDAAAYYIGKVANMPVRFYDDYTERDAEIEHLKEKLSLI